MRVLTGKRWMAAWVVLAITGCSEASPTSTLTSAAATAVSLDSLVQWVQKDSTAFNEATANESFATYYKNLIADASDAPLTVDGVQINGLLTYLQAAKPKFMQLSTRYETVGAAWRAFSIVPQPSAAGDAASIERQIVQVLTAYRDRSGAFADEPARKNPQLSLAADPTKADATSSSASSSSSTSSSGATFVRGPDYVPAGVDTSGQAGGGGVSRNLRHILPVYNLANIHAFDEHLQLPELQNAADVDWNDAGWGWGPNG